MRRLLWVGDAGVSSGFAKCTHEILNVVRRRWDVTVLGLNYQGDPHKYPYPIYACWPGGDGFGLGRMVQLIEKTHPDLVVVQNDPWNVPEYLKRVGNAPLAAIMPVDGLNVKDADKLNKLALAVFWTQFGLDEARVGGYFGPAEVIPLGVDLDTFRTGDRAAARAKLGLPRKTRNAFIVGNVNRNQPRKRLDLTVSYFAQWVKAYHVEDAYLYLHVAPTGDESFDVSQLMKYYKLSGRLIIHEPELVYGVCDRSLATTYQAFDVQVSTTQGEGWGLTTMEGMACGVPQVIPKWSALNEWVPDDAAVKVPCSEICVTPNRVNVIGATPDRRLFVDALQRLYSSRDERARLTANGLDLVERPEYRWERVGERFERALSEALA